MTEDSASVPALNHHPRRMTVYNARGPITICSDDRYPTTMYNEGAKILTIVIGDVVITINTELLKTLIPELKIKILTSEEDSKFLRVQFVLSEGLGQARVYNKVGLRLSEVDIVNFARMEAADIYHSYRQALLDMKNLPE